MHLGLRSKALVDVAICIHLASALVAVNNHALDNFFGGKTQAGTLSSRRCKKVPAVSTGRGKGMYVYAACLQKLCNSVLPYKLPTHRVELVTRSGER